MRLLRYSLLFAAACALAAPSTSAQHAFTTGPTLAQPVEGPEVGGGISITQNQNLTVEGGGVACGNQAGGYTVENTYYRVFPLAEFPQITEFFSVESVEFGVAPTTIATGGITTELRVYRMRGGVDFSTIFPVSALTLVASEELVINPGDPAGIYTVNMTESPDFAPTDTLAIAWNTPDGTNTVPPTYITYGYNDDGSEGTTYLQATACGAPNPTDVALLGAFGHLQWVVQVNGFLTPTAAEGGPELPRRVTLGQSYPNPVLRGATVPFTVHEPSHVRVAVYDALGREVAVLADGAYAAGTHAVTFEAEGVPGGTYLCRIEADGTVQSRTMTLVK